MSFKNYNDVADRLVLPIGDKEYTIPEVGMADGLRLSEMFEKQAAGEKFDPIPDDEFNRMLIGDVYTELLADNVPASAVRRIILTALADFQRGRAVAEVMWETGGDPKALETYVRTVTNRQQRRTAAHTTRRQGSGTTPKTTKK